MMCYRLRFSVVFAVISMLSVAGATPTSQSAAPPHPKIAEARHGPSIEVYFSPDGGCTHAVVAQIDAARQSIDVQAYSFTSAPIAKALVAAHTRGVMVRVVLDKSQKTAKYTSATFLYNNRVPIWIDSKHSIAHNKIMLIDRATIITGSFNFTNAAEENNAENLLIIKGYPNLLEEYESNFEDHLAHSKLYEGIDKNGAAG